MAQYLKRVVFDPEIEGVEPEYFIDRKMVPVSKADDVMIDLDGQFLCPDCGGTFLYSLKPLQDEWFADKYGCQTCHSVFTKRAPAA